MSTLNTPETASTLPVEADRLETPITGAEAGGEGSEDEDSEDEDSEGEDSEEEEDSEGDEDEE